MALANCAVYEKLKMEDGQIGYVLLPLQKQNQAI